MTYTEKIVFHIPHYTWSEGRVVPIDSFEFKAKLFSHWEGIGLNGWYVTESTGFFQGRRYTQDLVTVFCNSDQAESVIKAFCDDFQAANGEMRQSHIAYERNGVLNVLEM